MADPYQDDDDLSQRSDILTIDAPITTVGGKGVESPFAKALKHVGKTIQDGGFCSPNPKAKQPDLREVPNDEDSTESIHVETTAEVEPLIIKEDEDVATTTASVKEEVKKSDTLQEKNHAAAGAIKTKLKLGMIAAIVIALLAAVLLYACSFPEIAVLLKDDPKLITGTIVSFVVVSTTATMMIDSLPCCGSTKQNK